MKYTGNQTWTGEVDIQVMLSGQKSIFFRFEGVDQLEGYCIEKMLTDLGEALGEKHGLGKVRSIMISSKGFSIIMEPSRLKWTKIDSSHKKLWIGSNPLDIEELTVMFAYETPIIEVEEL